MSELHPRNVYVASLPRTFSDAELLAMFEPYGPVISAKVMCDKNGVSRGFGFVLFAHAASADAAIQGLVGASIQGTRIQVRKAKATSNTSVNSAAHGELGNSPQLVQYQAQPISPSFVPVFPPGYTLQAAPSGYPGLPPPNAANISQLAPPHTMALGPPGMSALYALPAPLTGPSVMQYPAQLVFPGSYPPPGVGAPPTLLSYPPTQLGDFSGPPGGPYVMMMAPAQARQQRPTFSTAAPHATPPPPSTSPSAPTTWELNH